MSTACWATNRLDVDIVTVYFGYGSRYDSCGTGPYHVSLEGLQCMARYDMVWKPVWPDEEIASDDWAGQYREGPAKLIFDGLNQHENDAKAAEWYKEAQPHSGKYGDIQVNYRWTDLIGKFPDIEMMMRIKYFYYISNGMMPFSRNFTPKHDWSSTIQYFGSSVVLDQLEMKRIASGRISNEEFDQMLAEMPPSELSDDIIHNSDGSISIKPLIKEQRNPFSQS